MGLDQHRAQITAEWVDTATGEVSRARVSPADRAAVRRFAGRFRGEDVEVALEATTGWRFVVEEFEGAGARVHLAEPAETAARRGPKKLGYGCAAATVIRYSKPRGTHGSATPTLLRTGAPSPVGPLAMRRPTSVRTAFRRGPFGV